MNFNNINSNNKFSSPSIVNIKKFDYFTKRKQIYKIAFKRIKFNNLDVKNSIDLYEVKFTNFLNEDNFKISEEILKLFLWIINNRNPLDKINKFLNFEEISYNPRSKQSTNKIIRLQKIFSESIGNQFSIENIINGKIYKTNLKNDPNNSIRIYFFYNNGDWEILLFDLYHLAISSNYRRNSYWENIQINYRKNKNNKINLKNIL